MNNSEVVGARRQAKRELGEVRSKVKSANRLIALCKKNTKEVLKANRKNEKISKRLRDVLNGELLL